MRPYYSLGRLFALRVLILQKIPGAPSLALRLSCRAQ